MALPDKLISQFAKILKPDTSKKETTLYGTIVQQGLSKFVKLDGSDLLTPISTTVDMQEGERVTVLLKNHTAIVTGNISSPAARTGTVAALQEKIADSRLINLIYPIGSIYLSVNPISPETLFGGKWEQIKDRFLLASGGGYELGVTGGEATHTLTEQELPKISGSFDLLPSESGNPVVSTSGVISSKKSSGGNVSSSSNSETTNTPHTVSINFGGGKAHNNMPPYLAVNIWKRIE